LRIKRRGILCLKRGRHRLFEDNADTDTGNTSKAQKAEMCHQQQTHESKPGYVEVDRDPENFALGKSLSESLGVLFEAPAALSEGPGGVRGELAGAK